MKQIFIINPTAGKGKSLELVLFIKSCFENREDECIIRITEYPGHATEIAREYCSREVCRVYSIGGDGTVNEIVNGMAGTTSTLGVIPTGSGNDFLRSILAPFDIKEMITSTINGQERSIDLARVNDKYFINISSIGFDAEVVFNANKFKRIPGIPGRLAYLFSIIYTVFQKRISTIKIDIDNKKMDCRILLAAIANGKYYGGGMLPTPDAELNDGLLDICLVSEASRLQILSLFPKYIKGLHGQLDLVSFYKGRKIRIESRESICLNIDGEIITAETMEFEVLEKAIKVVFPAHGGEQ